MKTNDIEEILEQARAALEPDDEDRRRVHAGILAAVGGSPAVTSGESTASAATGSSALKLTLVGLGVAGLIGGWLAYDRLSQSPAPEKKAIATETATATATGQGEAGHDAKTKPPEPRIAPSKPQPVETPSVKPSKQLQPAAEDTSRHAGRTQAKKNASPSKRPGRTRGPEAAKPAAAAENTLAAEMALIKKVSFALRQDSHRVALDLLDEYDAKFAQGVLRQESRGLRVLALCASNDPRALKANQRFLASAPRSPLASRIQHACKNIGSEK